MHITKLVEPAPDLPGQTWAQRLDYAASILFLHGYIPQSVRSKITVKLEKQFADGIAKGESVAREGGEA